MKFSFLLSVLIVFAMTITSYAQADISSAKHIAAIETSSALTAKKVIDTPEHEPGETPLSTLLAIRDASVEDNWEEAGKYLDMRYVSEDISAIGGGELIRQLSIVWSQQNAIDISSLSHSPSGHTNDGLPSYRDLLGVIETSKGNVKVYLQSVPNGRGGKVWKISNATVKKVPELWQEFGYSESIEKLAHYLPEFTLLHMNNWQFSAFILLVIFSWFLTSVLKKVAPIVFSKAEKNRDIYVPFLAQSLRMFLFFMMINHGTSYLGLSLSAKSWLSTGILTYCAVTYLLIGFIGLFTRLYLETIDKNSAAILRPIMTTFKIIVVIIMMLSWFDSAGYNIAAILTGLGIGSLAIALAAQKTLENVFGAFTLFIAKPIKPGDFCKFGKYSGTVEEIGLRSTRIRKLDRSVVHVPNSVFSSKELENFAEIDRRHYRRELRFRLDTSTDQLRQLLIKFRELILTHESVLPTAARARFEYIERDAFVVVFNCYIDTCSIVEFKAIAEDLNLYILDIVDELGVEWAIPQQQILLGKMVPTQENLAQEATHNMDILRAEQKLPFPDFSEEEVETQENTLSYPRKGTHQAKQAQLNRNSLDATELFEEGSTEQDGGRG